MYAEVERYEAGIENAQRTRRNALREADVQYNDGKICYDAYYSKRNEINHEYYKSLASEWQAMKTSPDPLVAFIIDNCGDYRNQAIEVLRELPADYEKLERIAADQDWCSVWDNYLDKAVEAGVVRGAPVMSHARRELLKWFREEFSSYRTNIEKLNELMDTVVAAESETAAVDA
jgi:hypothetical protein